MRRTLKLLLGLLILTTAIGFSQESNEIVSQIVTEANENSQLENLSP